MQFIPWSKMDVSSVLHTGLVKSDQTSHSRACQCHLGNASQVDTGNGTHLGFPAGSEGPAVRGQHRRCHDRAAFRSPEEGTGADRNGRSAPLAPDPGWGHSLSGHRKPVVSSRGETVLPVGDRRSTQMNARSDRASPVPGACWRVHWRVAASLDTNTRDRGERKVVCNGTRGAEVELAGRAGYPAVTWRRQIKDASLFCFEHQLNSVGAVFGAFHAAWKLPSHAFRRL